MPARPRRPRRLLASPLTSALVAAALLTGCTGEEAPPEASDSASPSASAPRGAGPGESASAYPVPAAASPSPLPDLGTATAGDLTFTLNAVRRVSPEAVVVEGTLTAANRNVPLLDLAEPGYRVREADGERLDTYEFSAVTLAAQGDPQVYLPLRDDEGFCACTAGILALDEDRSMGVYTYVTAPQDADTVDLNVASFGSFTGVPVTD